MHSSPEFGGCCTGGSLPTLILRCSYNFAYRLPDKTEDDADREAQLLEMRLTLTEERNAIMVPSAGSGIPGAPAEWYGSGHMFAFVACVDC